MAWNSANLAWFESQGHRSLPQAPIAKAGGYEYGPSFNLYYHIPAETYKGKDVYFIPTRFNQLPKVDPNIMKQTFKKYLNFGMYTEYVAKMMLRRFAEVAAKYSPPNIGKATIDQKYYYRPVYKLEDLAKGLVRTEKGRILHATRDDYAALRAGMKFKIVNTKHGMRIGSAYAYAKGINQAKRLSRIENRGLTKYSWGSILNTFINKNIQMLNKDLPNPALGAPSSRGGKTIKRYTLYASDMPPIFGRLERKSPNIKKYRWGAITWKPSKDGRKLSFTIENNLAEVERYCDIAIRQGLTAAVKEVRKLIGYIQNDVADKIQKLFNFGIYRVTQVTALTRIKERTLK